MPVGSSTVLAAALQSLESGADRMSNALVGGGVALGMREVLLPSSPVSLLERARCEGLGLHAEGLHASARALGAGNVSAARTALQRLRLDGWNTMSGPVEAW